MNSRTRPRAAPGGPPQAVEYRVCAGRRHGHSAKSPERNRSSLGCAEDASMTAGERPGPVARRRGYPRRVRASPFQALTADRVRRALERVHGAEGLATSSGPGGGLLDARASASSRRGLLPPPDGRLAARPARQASSSREQPVRYGFLGEPGTPGGPGVASGSVRSRLSDQPAGEPEAENRMTGTGRTTASTPSPRPSCRSSRACARGDDHLAQPRRGAVSRREGGGELFDQVIHRQRHRGTSGIRVFARARLRTGATAGIGASGRRLAPAQARTPSSTAATVSRPPWEMLG